MPIVISTSIGNTKAGNQRAIHSFNRKTSDKRALQTYRDNGLIPYSNIGGKFFYKEVDIQQILEEGLIKKRK